MAGRPLKAQQTAGCRLWSLAFVLVETGNQTFEGFKHGGNVLYSTFLRVLWLLCNLFNRLQGAESDQLDYGSNPTLKQSGSVLATQ